MAALCEVDDIAEVTERARAMGARVALEPREGPIGLAQRDRDARGGRNRALAAETRPCVHRIG